MTLDPFENLLRKSEHDRALVDATHPPDWQNPKPAGRYNLVVIGGGTAGLVSAVGSAGLGARVALVERHLLGGDCLNYGCVPSKALIAAARTAHTLRRGADFGIRAAMEIDFGAMMERLRQSRARIAHHDAAARVSKMGVEVFFGNARFTGADTLDVDGTRLRFARAVVATGSHPAAPPIPGLAQSGYLNNETLFSLTRLPPRLAVIGGGPIGCEMSQSLARLGARVTLLQRSSRLLPRDARRASELIRAVFENEGIHVVLGADLRAVSTNEGAKRIEYHDAQGNQNNVDVDQILVATGRTPNIESLELDRAGIHFTERGVVVDDRLRTSNARVFAAGDCCSRFQFTHAADAMARVVIQNALFFGRKRQSALNIPWCTYTDPEVAHVGIDERDATHRRLSSVEVELEQNDRAIVELRTAGFAMAHYRGRRGRIEGATLVAPDGGNLIAQVVLAMDNGIGLGHLAHTIHPYPTQSELMKRLGDAYRRKQLSPRLVGLLRRFFAWRR